MSEYNDWAFYLEQIAKIDSAIVCLNNFPLTREFVSDTDFLKERINKLKRIQKTMEESAAGGKE